MHVHRINEPIRKAISQKQYEYIQIASFLDNAFFGKNYGNSKVLKNYVWKIKLFKSLNYFKLLFF